MIFIETYLSQNTGQVQYSGVRLVPFRSNAPWKFEKLSKYWLPDDNFCFTCGNALIFTGTVPIDKIEVHFKLQIRDFYCSWVMPLESLKNCQNIGFRMITFVRLSGLTWFLHNLFLLIKYKSSYNFRYETSICSCVMPLEIWNIVKILVFG